MKMIQTYNIVGGGRQTHRNDAGTTHQTALPSADEDAKRLFDVCATGRGDAASLQEALLYIRPEDIKDSEEIRDLRARCRTSQEWIFSQITWATVEAERSRRVAQTLSKTMQERLLAAVLRANEELTAVLKMYDDLERIRTDKEDQDRRESERVARVLTSIFEFTPTPAESSLIDQVFNIGDPHELGTISIHAASKIFNSSRLSPTMLAKIWEIANVEEKETLDRQVVGVTIRLIGYAQNGREIDEKLVKTPGPVATINDIHNYSFTEPITSSSRDARCSILPPLTEAAKAEFTELFYTRGPRNGLLNGDIVENILAKSGLPLETLAHIWDLADTKKRGALDLPGFIIALYLTRAAATRKLPSIPLSLPDHIYEQAAQQSQNEASTSAHSYSLIPATPGSSSDGAITPTLKTRADRYFEDLDVTRSGLVGGDVASNFLLKSGLPLEILSHIWELADTNKDGYLTKDEFAVAMYLIQAKMRGKELPSSLPPSLVPPSIRNSTMSATQPTQSLIDFDDTQTFSPVNSLVAMRHLSPQLFAPHSPLTEQSSPANTQFAFSPTAGLSISSSSTGQHATGMVHNWTISTAEKASADRFFDTLDSWRQGYLERDIGLPFLKKSKLPDDLLLRIWNLADVNHDGRLNRDEFAIAMQIIKGRLAGNEVPASPPPALIPAAPSTGDSIPDNLELERSDTPPPAYQEIVSMP